MSKNHQTDSGLGTARWLARIRAKSKKNGTDKLSMAAIDRIVAIVRKKQRSSDQP